MRLGIPFLVGVTAYQGGTGKTTVAFNAGLEFARPRGFDGVPACPVVMIDLDPQGQAREGGRTLVSLFEDGPFERHSIRISVSDFRMWKVEYDPNGFDDIVRKDVPFGTALLAVPRKELGRINASSLRRLIGEVHELVGDPPIALVDTPPMNVRAEWVRNILVECDLVVPVADFRSIKQLSRFFRESGYVTRFAVLNKVFEGRTKDDELLRKRVKEELSRLPIDTESDLICVPDSEVIRVATDLGVPVRMRFNSYGYATPFRRIARRITLEWSRRVI
ncbi:ParA family protein [Methanopyrus sp. KOL6]|uniref:ParA family protein n=1 Tax=Methanopyrus sp. KOL6 TaxID=1937004 RepID=UPI000B4C06F2|nr:ParA family protein [Methanopyrus sp. KOL6]